MVEKKKMNEYIYISCFHNMFLLSWMVMMSHPFFVTESKIYFFNLFSSMVQSVKTNKSYLGIVTLIKYTRETFCSVTNLKTR